MLVSRDPSLLGALKSTLGLEDMYDLIEIFQIDAHNDGVVRRILRRRER